MVAYHRSCTRPGGGDGGACPRDRRGLDGIDGIEEALVSLVQPLYEGMLKGRHVSINSARQERMHILGG